MPGFSRRRFASRRRGFSFADWRVCRSRYRRSRRSRRVCLWEFFNHQRHPGARSQSHPPGRAASHRNGYPTRLRSRLQLQTASGRRDRWLAHSQGEATSPATVSFTTRDATAQAGKDYVATTATLSFEPLEVEKIVTVPIIDDAAFDGFRTLQLYLTNAVGAEFIAPPLTMTILDDEFGIEPGTVKRLADGSVRMIAQFPPFSSVWLEVSSDLKKWTSATNLQWNYASPFESEFIDPDAANFPLRFYRVRTQ